MKQGRKRDALDFDAFSAKAFILRSQATENGTKQAGRRDWETAEMESGVR